MITKTFTITATEDTMEKFERFMGFLHYNGGHTGTFGMTFDGDGHEEFKSNPAPLRDIGPDGYSLRGKCASTGQDVEIVVEKGYHTYNINWNENRYEINTTGFYKISPDGKKWKKNYKTGEWEKFGSLWNR